MASKGLFVTGTDTGVGKTLVAGGLARWLRDLGLAPGVLKPVETGCPLRRGKRIPRDGTFLRYMAGAPDPIESIVPYRLATPLAPQVAAEKEGVRIRFDRILGHYRRIASRHPCTVVEGAGGILVPVTRQTTMVDLMRRFELPVLVVGRAGLGTLNHTLLTLYYLAQHGIHVAGVILSDTDGRRDPAKASNLEVLRRRCSVPLFGTLPHVRGIGAVRRDADRIVELLAAHADLQGILRTIDP